MGSLYMCVLERGCFPAGVIRVTACVSVCIGSGCECLYAPLSMFFGMNMHVCALERL